MKPSDHPGAVRRADWSGLRAGKARLLKLFPMVGLTLAGGLYLGRDLSLPGRPASLPAAARPEAQPEAMPPALRAAYVRARQEEAGSDYDFVASEAERPASFASHNPVMGLVAQAGREGIRLQPSGGRGSSVGLSLMRQGCSDRPAEAAAVTPQARGNRVEYSRDGITEWYINGPLGLEQGFTVARDLGCQRPLVFEMELDRSVAAELRSGGTVVALNAAGRHYRYAELYAYDADGRELPSRMELAGQRLRLVVDAAGARYPVEVDPRMYIEQAGFIASDSAIDDTFGSAVAYSGDTAVIGAPTRNTARGQTYIFVRSGLKWSEQAKLNSSDGATLDNFGSAVAIDGNTVVIGAPQKSSQLGQAYVFTRSGTKWTQQAKLLASDGASGDYFGTSVAISADTAVVGITSSTRNAAYVFLRSGTKWTQQAKLTPSDDMKGYRFGVSVAVDVDTAVVGASDKPGAGGAAQGAAYVFVRSAGTWSQESQLTASDGAMGDKFGYAVSVNTDTALVGAYRKTVGNNAAQGAAYVYTRAAGVWSEQAQLLAADGAAQDQFGVAVSVTGDVAVVGANQADLNNNLNQGAAYVYSRSGTAWSQYAKLSASNGNDNDFFGSTVSVGSSGNTVVVGAPLRTVGVNPAAGQAYVYGLEPQDDGSTCITGSDCLSGSCVNSVCVPATSTVTDMGTATDANQLALLGSGLGGGGCTLSGRRAAPATEAPLGTLAVLLGLALLRRRTRNIE